ncbi:MAG: response regulator transcription factor [Acidimicrobiales bacterium]
MRAPVQVPCPVVDDGGSQPAVGSRRYSVIVADDHEDDRFLIRRALEREGSFEVVAEAHTGAQAVSLATLHQPDLAVVDLAMPDLDGLMTTGALRHASPATTVVVLSNFGSARMANPARLAGAAAYLEKSTPPKELVAAILAALERSSPDPAASDPDLARTILTADGLAPMVARRFVTRVLEDWAMTERSDEILLLVSELVTNAVVHAQSDLEVVMAHAPGILRVEVHDRDPRRVVALAWTEDQERGRGVALVEALSDVWGTDDVDVGKVIWFEITV